MDDIVLPVIIRPFLSLFEVLGINSPFPRRWRYFLGISANLFFLTLLLLYYQQYHAVDKNHQFMEYFNDGIQLIVTEAAIMIVFLETIHKHRKYMRFFREVSQFNSSCRQMNVDVDTFYTGSIRAFAWQFVVLVAGSTVVEALIILNIAIDQQWVVYWHVNILPLSLVRLRQLQLSYFLRIPSVHLKVLEDLLKRFVKVTNKRQAHEKEFVESINRRLCELKRLHGIVLHEMRIFNEIFSYSLAFHLLQNFVELLSGSYWLYYYNLDNHCVFAAVLTCIPTPVLLLYSLYTYEMIPGSRRRIIGRVHKINHLAINPKGRGLLRKFILQVHSGDIDVFPLRLVKFDFRFFKNMIVGISSTLVIFIYFNYVSR